MCAAPLQRRSSAGRREELNRGRSEVVALNREDYDATTGGPQVLRSKACKMMCPTGTVVGKLKAERLGYRGSQERDMP
jgi:hypothetical protein